MTTDTWTTRGFCWSYQILLLHPPPNSCHRPFWSCVPRELQVDPGTIRREDYGSQVGKGIQQCLEWIFLWKFRSHVRFPLIDLGSQRKDEDGSSLAENGSRNIKWSKWISQKRFTNSGWPDLTISNWDFCSDSFFSHWTIIRTEKTVDLQRLISLFWQRSVSLITWPYLISFDSD